uniref:Uncharacterized protein n=1 Tax=Glossina palpalis gambiensis TaxID=67801 RepID=A0A1B0AR58_9MUSC
MGLTINIISDALFFKTFSQCGRDSWTSSNRHRLLNVIELLEQPNSQIEREQSLTPDKKMVCFTILRASMVEGKVIAATLSEFFNLAMLVFTFMSTALGKTFRSCAVFHDVIFAYSVYKNMTLIDNIRDWFASETARNKNSSLIAGLLFFAGWWTLIDAMTVDQKHQITTGQVFIGVFGTISFFMVNVVKNSHNFSKIELGLTDETQHNATNTLTLTKKLKISEENTSESGARVAKIWLLIAFVMGFASIIAAVWVMIDDFINNSTC